MKYIKYFITASNGRGHGIHSPFVYDLVRNVFMNKNEEVWFQIPERYRRDLLKDHSLIEVTDYGAGSTVGISKTRKVSDIAKWALKNKKYAQLLYRLTAYYKWEHILELGTSFGVTTGYLSLPETVRSVCTIEGSASISNKAKAFFNDAGLTKIKPCIGVFDDILPGVLTEMTHLDMVFIDGNHRKHPTLQYFQMIIPLLHSNSCVIFDDIHWSREMEDAWEMIKNQPQVTCTIDLFFIGIVFFRKEFREVQHFEIRY